MSDIHGGNKRSVDSPAWRHIKAIASLVSDDGNTAKVQGFYDDAIAPTAAQLKAYAAQAKTFDVDEAARNLGVARFIHENAADILRDRNWISSRSPQDLPVFVPAMIELFAAGAEAPATGALASASTANESSPQPTEPIRAAVKAARFLPSPTIAALGGAAMAVALGAIGIKRLVA